MTPTTKLEAVNIMLSTIGESPVNSLSSGLVDAELAETILDATSRAVQSEAWHFNRELKVRFAPNLSGEIILPTNTLKADANLDADSINRQTSTGLPLDLVQRGTRMYDKTNHTFNIGKSVELDIVVGLDFDDLPEVAKRYITIKAGRTFQDRVVGSSTLHGFQEADEARSYYELKETEGDTSDFNILNNYDVFAVIDRVSGRRIY